MKKVEILLLKIPITEPDGNTRVRPGGGTCWLKSQRAASLC